ncbi:MAG TPA: DNA polymerase domain-containing protein, partial [Rhodothermales bacterium]|nr:DNA polymerase domain-containing protein [Rhodothermales bacterium]
FDEATEVVTVEGVKRVSEVRVGELVYALNPKTLQAEVKPVDAVFAQPYEGPMVELRTPHVDFLVTPEHRFLTSKHTSSRHQPFAWERAEDLFVHRQRRRLPPLVPLPARIPAPERFSLKDACQRLGIAFKTGPRGIKELRQQGRWQPESYALNDWLALVGWYVSEGTLYRSKPRRFDSGHVRGECFRVTLCQKRPEGRAAIAALLDRMGIAYGSDQNGLWFSSRVLYEVLEAECGHGSYHKYLPPWVFSLPPERLSVLFDTLMAGDGHTNGGRYTTASADLARDFQRLALHVGQRVFPAAFDGCYRFHVNASRGTSPTFKPEHRRHVPYNGQVYCLTVADHHTVLAGRNGRFNWTGQSFYGSLGFGFAAFNDFAEADRVAATGQELLKTVIAAVRQRGGTVVEVDTDGILFVPPADIESEAEEKAFVARLNDVLPEGIRIAYEGRAAKMLSYKKKNYALLGYDGKLKFKGSSLVSRSTERFGRAFVREAVKLLLAEDVAGLHALYTRTREAILRRDWPHGADDFSRTETLKDSVEEYRRDVSEGKRPRAAAYELAIALSERTGVPVRVGDRMSFYVTGTSASVTTYDNARLAAEWRADAPDENTAFYLKRLDEFARKFAPFFSEHDFRQVFSPPDLFGFDAASIRLVQHVREAGEADEEVPF